MAGDDIEKLISQARLTGYRCPEEFWKYVEQVQERKLHALEALAKQKEVEIKEEQLAAEATERELWYQLQLQVELQNSEKEKQRAEKEKGQAHQLQLLQLQAQGSGSNGTAKAPVVTLPKIMLPVFKKGEQIEPFIKSFEELVVLYK